MKKILIADDEQGIRNLLKDQFEMNGYLVYTAKDGREALEKMSCQPDIILLDINMPAVDGMEVCRQVRNHVACPIIFLTAKVEEQDRVNGFRAGGDDYVMKPFSLEELTARVEAHLRREQRSMSRTESRFLRDLVIDYGQHAVYCKDQPVNFPKKEYEILEFLSMNPGQVFDRETLYERIWGFDSDGDSGVIAEHIRRIRNKLSAITEEVYIETVWGVGYKWVK